MRQARMTRNRRPRRERDHRRPTQTVGTPRGGPDPELDEELLRRIERLLLANRVSTA